MQLFADRSSKAFASQIKPFVDPVYELAMPSTQVGAVSGRSTDFASHIVRSLVDLADIQAMSIFVLFLDLIETFDWILREFVLGRPTNFCGD